MKTLNIPVLAIAFLLCLPAYSFAPLGGGTPPQREVRLSRTASIYLNATEDQLIIDLRKVVHENTQVYIFNVAFGELFRGEWNMEQKSVDISAYPPGLYYVRLQSGDDVYIKKVVKQK
ncbi:MAG: T9SS C-terminal target domain-containing protein [Bacteroidetes bacterium]|nr:MAG: T9SS C-terminal target domain-containing protein [Bacteroidota bacterium]